MIGRQIKSGPMSRRLLPRREMLLPLATAETVKSASKVFLMIRIRKISARMR
jgi:hypothetical protein